MTGSKTQAGDSAAPIQVPANLLRVLAACVYDGLLSLTILFVATAITLPFTQGEAIRSGDILYDLYLLIMGFPYFAYSWTRGQTLGMRAWKLHLRTEDGALPNLRQCLVRYLGACISWICLGLGFLWIGIDRQQRSWHDGLSGTRIVRHK
jgi:uncharacterized RDD family membrane protein YckC